MKKDPYAFSSGLNNTVPVKKKMYTVSAMSKVLVCCIVSGALGGVLLLPALATAPFCAVPRHFASNQRAAGKRACCVRGAHWQRRLSCRAGRVRQR